MKTYSLYYQGKHIKNINAESKEAALENYDHDLYDVCSAGASDFEHAKTAEINRLKNEPA